MSDDSMPPLMEPGEESLLDGDSSSDDGMPSLASDTETPNLENLAELMELEDYYNAIEMSMEDAEANDRDGENGENDEGDDDEEEASGDDDSDDDDDEDDDEDLDSSDYDDSSDEDIPDHVDSSDEDIPALFDDRSDPFQERYNSILMEGHNDEQVVPRLLNTPLSLGLAPMMRSPRTTRVLAISDRIYDRFDDEEEDYQPWQSRRRRAAIDPIEETSRVHDRRRRIREMS